MKITKGLADECSQRLNEIGISDKLCFETTEQYIKNAIWQKIVEKALEEKKKKVSDRLKQKILKTICVSIPSHWQRQGYG